jgi:hypothetical protein
MGRVGLVEIGATRVVARSIPIGPIVIIAIR